MTKDIEIWFEDKPFSAFLSAPDTTDAEAKKLPGVIVIHEVWGLNQHTKDVANRIAALGYTVLAPDLLSHTGITEKMTPDIFRDMADPAKKDEAQKKMRAAMAPIQEPAFGAETVSRLQACYDYLKNEQGAPTVACIGFCFGGTYTFAFAAAQPELNAAIAFYGHATTRKQLKILGSKLWTF
jgi:carboxymethylenebutenolidase